MTEAMPFLQKYDITFLRPPTIRAALCFTKMPCCKYAHHYVADDKKDMIRSSVLLIVL